MLSVRHSHFFVCVCRSHACVYAHSHVQDACMHVCVSAWECVCAWVCVWHVRGSRVAVSPSICSALSFLRQDSSLNSELPNFTSDFANWHWGFLISALERTGIIGRPTHPPCIFTEVQLSPVPAMCSAHSVISLVLECAFLTVPQKIESTNDFTEVL